MLQVDQVARDPENEKNAGVCPEFSQGETTES